MHTYWYHTVLVVYYFMFLYNQGYKKTTNSYFILTSWIALVLHKKIVKRNSQKRKQKTKPYNYKTEILGCFINQQLLTEMKQHLMWLIISFRHTP